MKKIVDINEDLCIGCGACVILCPMKILYIDEKTQKCKVINDKICDKRKGCEKVCPVSAIKINK